MNTMYMTDLSYFLPGLTTSYTYSCVEPGDKDPETNKVLEPESYKLEYNGNNVFIATECVNEITDDYINLPVQVLTKDDVLKDAGNYSHQYSVSKAINSLKRHQHIFVKHSWEYIEDEDEGKQIVSVTNMITNINEYMIIFDCTVDFEKFYVFNTKTLEYTAIEDETETKLLQTLKDIGLSEFIEVFNKFYTRY